MIFLGTTLFKKNIHPQSVIKIGSPIKEVYQKNKINITKSNILKNLK